MSGIAEDSLPSPAGLPALHEDQGLNNKISQEPPIDQVREEIVAAMRGSNIVVPDLQHIISHWPAGVHPELKRLEEDVMSAFESMTSSPSDERRLRKLKESGVALLGASCSLYGTMFSTLIHKFEEARAFRCETMQFLQETLSQDSTLSSLMDISTNPIITNFRPMGEAISRSWNDRQVNRFLNEMRFFVDMTEEEHRCQMARRIPTVEEYIRRRMGSSAVGDQSQVDSLIPLLFVKLKSVQAAIDWAANLVRSAVERFDAAERKILECHASDPHLQEHIHKFIDGCKYAVTGNLSWR
ncbi:hypothetical protein DL765_000640 [Monosporascus sp. GIB2]|nr:hypothetical protein DL765_000640 [Monosporascus sp. GIB2]